MQILTSQIVVAVLVAVAVFVAVQALLSVVLRRQAPRTAQIQALIAEQERLSSRAPIKDRLMHWAGQRGYTGTLGPIVFALTSSYLAVALVLKAFLGAPPIALILAVPATWGVVLLAVARVANQRKLNFDRQFLDALVALATQLEAGIGIPRALAHVQANASSPLKEELGVALRQMDANRNDRIGPMQALAQRYPSRAFDLFLAALRIDEEIGGRIEPALREAASIMQRDFSIIAEAQAEISQTKSEFYGILIMICFIFFGVITGGGEEARKLYFSPSGILVLIFCASWAGLGIWLCLGTMRKAAGASRSKLPRRRRAPELGVGA